MFDPFSQLSLVDPFTPGNGGGILTAPAPETPPPPVPTSEDAIIMTSGVNFAHANAGVQHHHQQQQLHFQPMHVTPDQGALDQQQGQLPAYGSKYQLDAFDQAPPIMHQRQQQQPQQQMTFPIQQVSNNFNMVVADNSLMSPPISPLWKSASAMASPMGSPMGGTYVANGINNMQLVPTQALPHDKSMAASATTVSVQNPFDLFNDIAPAPSAAPVAPPVPADPINIAAPSMLQQHQAQGKQQDDADFWNDMGFGLPKPSINIGDGIQSLRTPGNDSDYSSSGDSEDDDDTSYNEVRSRDETPVTLDERGLPAGGEYYNARVTTPLLGAIFSSGFELRSTLLKSASNSFLESIGDRPVISFIIDGGAADTAGIQLGHILLGVNGEKVSTTDEAVRMIGAAPRPMSMEFYIPNKDIKVVKTEGQCMVKYDDQSPDAPASVYGWKPKYVVVGDMLGKPHILYMYRTKAEYDIAVKESQTRNKSLSVKVKQFDIRGSVIYNEQGTVRYPYKPTWHYFTVVRRQGLPIKISSTNVEELQSVYEGIVTFLDKEARLKQIRTEEQKDRLQSGMQYRETYY